MSGPTQGADDEDGTILLLLLGYVLLSLAVILVCVCATDLYIAQKRLDALAESAALAGADGFALVFDDGVARAELSDAGVRAQAEEILVVVGADAGLAAASTPDGVSARVTVVSAWHPPLFSLFVPDGVPLEATATSRTALE
ncbi:MAG: hypothetical protein ACQEW8_04425 [Actinomycetota bacterium]